jgi:hypothetical protein
LITIAVFENYHGLIFFFLLSLKKGMIWFCESFISILIILCHNYSYNISVCKGQMDGWSDKNKLLYVNRKIHKVCSFVSKCWTQR